MSSKDKPMNKIEQVKLLLFGENMDEINERISELERLVESNSRAFEKAVLDTKNEILSEMTKNHNLLLASLQDTNKDKDAKLDALKKKTSDDKKDLEKKAAEEKKAMETKVANNQKAILDALNKQHLEMTASLNNLEAVKAERKQVDEAFGIMKEAFEKISKVL